MASAIATENLRPSLPLSGAPACARRVRTPRLEAKPEVRPSPVKLTLAPAQAKSPLLSLLLRFEAWLDARASRKVLYNLDERALADIGLTSADVAGFDRTEQWQDHLIRPAGRD